VRCGLGEQHIKHDHFGARRTKAPYQLGNTRARPGPLTIGFQTGFVDIHHADRRRDAGPLVPALKLIELGQPQLSNHIGIKCKAALFTKTNPGQRHSIKQAANEQHKHCSML